MVTDCDNGAIAKDNFGVFIHTANITDIIDITIVKICMIMRFCRDKFLKCIFEMCNNKFLSELK
jgi:hypothetical protein